MGKGDLIRETIQKYGRLALGVHISLSILSYIGCYYVAKYGNLNSETFKKYFLNKKDTEQPQEGSQSVKKLTTYGSAYIIYKALMPVRVPITIAVVTFIAKFKKI